ncbi:MAG: glycosyltransferase family 2 protein [Candidatus Marinimicrobia bacterium]|nr:glycosyltransferase family 2 protein [Candidatus Neomarinimicrobiota bacterium]
MNEHYEKNMINKLSIIIPCYNEKDTIEEIIAVVNKVDIGDIEKEIIIVDDYSTDGTREILREQIEQQVDKVIYKDENGGKGSAVTLAIKKVTGDYFIIQDADLEYDPNDYIKLLNKIKQENASVCYGTRFADKKSKSNDNGRKIMLSHYFGNKFLTSVINFFFRTKITDMETCYKMIKTDAVKGMKIKSKRFNFEPEITAKLLKGDNQIVETSISYFPRTFEEGKKINWMHGIEAIIAIIKYRIMN